MPTITTQMPAVIVEFTHKDARVQRHFDDPFAARRFYVLQDKAGNKPCVLNPEKAKGTKAMTTTRTATTKKTAAKTKSKKAAVALTEGDQEVLDLVYKFKATSEATAVPRDKVWKALKVGRLANCANVRKAGFIAWAIFEDRSKGFYLTPAGRKLVAK